MRPSFVWRGASSRRRRGEPDETWAWINRPCESQGCSGWRAKAVSACCDGVCSSLSRSAADKLGQNHVPEILCSEMNTLAPFGTPPEVSAETRSPLVHDGSCAHGARESVWPLFQSASAVRAGLPCAGNAHAAPTSTARRKASSSLHSFPLSPHKAPAGR